MPIGDRLNYEINDKKGRFLKSSDPTLKVYHGACKRLYAITQHPYAQGDN